MTDFSNFKKVNSSNDRSTFTIKVKSDLYERFKSVKKEHSAAKCVPLDMERVVDNLLAEAIDFMNKEIEEKSKVKK